MRDRRDTGAGASPSPVSDVPLDSQDFWTHLTTRTTIQYGRWISDTRQAVNQYVADMGTAEASRWIGSR